MYALYAGNPDSWPRLNTSALNKSHRDSYFQIRKLDPGTAAAAGLVAGSFSCLRVSWSRSPSSLLTSQSQLYCTVLYCCTVPPGPHPHPHLSITTEFRLQSSPPSYRTLTYHRATQVFYLEITIPLLTQMKLFLYIIVRFLSVTALQKNGTLGAGYVTALTVRWMEPSVTTRRDHCGDVTPSHNTQFLFEAKFSSHPVSAQILHKS